METIWFCLVAVMVALYVLLDGFDLGAGAIHFLVAKTEEERRQVLASIGPVWDGNEVWLLAAGGTLYFAFPALYASGFSGFYLPLMIVLWLLILRGTSIEFRNHIKSPIWIPFWDFFFSFSSLLLAIFFGAALANVVRGVPLDQSGYFFEPLWTNFRLGEQTGILDWYTILVGVQALLVLMMHGALWLQWKTVADLNKRAARVAGWTWWGVLILTALVTALTFSVSRKSPSTSKPGRSATSSRCSLLPDSPVFHSNSAARTNATPSSLPACTSSACSPASSLVSTRWFFPRAIPSTRLPCTTPKPLTMASKSASSGGSSAWPSPPFTSPMSTAPSQAKSPPSPKPTANPICRGTINRAFLGSSSPGPLSSALGDLCVKSPSPLQPLPIARLTSLTNR